jgi:hypothetical protein
MKRALLLSMIPALFLFTPFSLHSQSKKSEGNEKDPGKEKVGTKKEMEEAHRSVESDGKEIRLKEQKAKKLPRRSIDRPLRKEVEKEGERPKKRRRKKEEEKKRTEREEG